MHVHACNEYMLILFVFVLSATKSLSSGEVEAIIICCSLFLVGVIIIVIILSIFGFMFKKKQLHAVQTLTSAQADKRQQTFQSDEVNMQLLHIVVVLHVHVYITQVSGYTLCTTDYDQIVIVTVSNYCKICITTRAL